MPGEPNPIRTDLLAETREKESWLTPESAKAEATEATHQQLLASAALMRGVVQAIRVPTEAEHRSQKESDAVLSELDSSASPAAGGGLLETVRGLFGKKK